MRRLNKRVLRNINDYDNYNYETRVYSDELIDVNSLDFINMKDKQKTHYVESIERIIRSSMEYREFIKFLREYMDMDNCSFYRKIKKKCKNIKIEIHHDPFSLYDLVYTCIMMFISEGIELNDLAIAQEVVHWHYVGLVGLIPLSKTVHKLVHLSKIFIPVNCPYGDFDLFYNQYQTYMGESLKSTYREIVEESRKFDNKPPEVLKKRYVYMSVDGFELPERI